MSSSGRGIDEVDHRVLNLVDFVDYATAGVEQNADADWNAIVVMEYGDVLENAILIDCKVLLLQIGHCAIVLIRNRGGEAYESDINLRRAEFPGKHRRSPVPPHCNTGESTALNESKRCTHLREEHDSP